MKLLTIPLLLASTLTLSATNKPNIVIILTDDQGYADISFNPDHPKEVATPHMDSLAEMVASEKAGKPAGARSAADLARLSKEEQIKRREKRKKAREKKNAQ